MAHHLADHEDQESSQHQIRQLEAPKSAEVAYFETRAMKLMYQQVFQYMHEENLTLFEDSVVTAQAASIFLDFKSTQIGGNKFMVLPVDFLQTYSNDIDKCAKLLRASSLLPFETSEVKDFDNLVLVIGADNLVSNPPTLFIVRNLRQAEHKNPSIHVWKSSESFQNSRASNMIKGGLTEREIQVQILLRRVLSHRLIGQGKNYTIESLPSHTILISPTFTDRIKDSQETKKARSLLQNATNLASKFRGMNTDFASVNNQKGEKGKTLKSGNEVHPSDEEFVGVSPLMTLMTGFLLHGMDSLQEPRASLSKINSVQEINITRQDMCEVVDEMRDFLYCIYDTGYFDHGDNQNQTLTQSMFVEQISMSPKRREPQVIHRKQPKAQEKVVRNKRSRHKRRNSSPSCDRSPSHHYQDFNNQNLSVPPKRAVTPEQQFASSPERHRPIPPYWAEDQQEEMLPEVLQMQAQPQYLQNNYGLSPTKDLMDRHHDMDDLTAHQHQHQMIQVYRPGDSNPCSDRKDAEADSDNNEYQVESTYRPRTSTSENVNHVRSKPESGNKVKERGFFSEKKESITGVIPPSMPGFDHFKLGKSEIGEEQSVDEAFTERSSAQFGDGTLAPAVLTQSQQDQELSNRQRPSTQNEESKTGRHNKKSDRNKVAVPKVKSVSKERSKGAQKKTSSKVRRKGDAIIEQILQNFQKQAGLYEQLNDCQTKPRKSTLCAHKTNQISSRQPQALRTRVRSASIESSNERALQLQLQQLQKKSSKSREKQKMQPAISRQQQLLPQTSSKASMSKQTVTTSQKDSKGRAAKKSDKLSFKMPELSNLDQIAQYTSGGQISSARSKLRFKKSPPRSSNSDNLVPQLSNQKNQIINLMTETVPERSTPMGNGIYVARPGHGTDVSRSKSKETVDMGEIEMEAALAVELLKRGENIFDVGMPSDRESLEQYQQAIAKCQTEKILRNLPSKKLLGTKKKNVTKPSRGNSNKQRLQFLIRGDLARKEAEPQQKKRKEMIQELRQSAAKIVIESQEKAKKATKNRLKEAQQMQRIRQSQLASQQQVTTIDQTPFSFLATSLDSDGHAPAVMSPKMFGGTAHYSSSQQVLPMSKTQKIGSGTGQSRATKRHQQQ